MIIMALNLYISSNYNDYSYNYLENYFIIDQ